MGKMPNLTGNIQDNSNTKIGDLALWSQDYDNEDAPDYQGSISIDADILRDKLDDNPDASELLLNLSVWE